MSQLHKSSSAARTLLAAGLLVTSEVHATAQSNLQLWGTLTAVKAASERLSVGSDVELKWLLATAGDEARWASLDVTPVVEYFLTPRFDLVGELATGYTVQTDDVNSFELSPRGGVRLHLTARNGGRAPLRQIGLGDRIVLRNLVRVEQRTLFYTGDVATDAVVRFRNRLEMLVPMNEKQIGDDGARYLLADWEWFIPIDDPAERFANRQRIRTGFALRRSATWRFEALYIWTRSRETIEEGFATSDNTINVRVRRAF
jgi:hypothetical protein